MLEWEQRRTRRLEAGSYWPRDRESQAVAKAFASVYYNNADKEIQFHWYRLKVQYTRRFMASERSVKNLKMIPPTSKRHTKTARAESREPKRSVFAAFVLLRGFVRQKDSCSWSRYTAQNYQILAHTYSFFMSAAADIKIQRDKDPEIQDTCLLSHTNDFW